jgi:hypothetical protein
MDILNWLYAGKTVVSRATCDIIIIMSTSNNATSAEYQQERLIKIGWIIGFVDGEGCFSLGVIKQSDKKEETRIRRGYKLGIQISHEFAVTQGEKSLKSLLSIKDFFGVGSVYINRRHDNHKENLYRYVVRKRSELLNVIIPLFEKNHLQTQKIDDFRIFAQGVKSMNKGLHLKKKGLISLLLKIEKMNHKKSKQNLIKILRNQTPKSNIKN